MTSSKGKPPTSRLASGSPSFPLHHTTKNITHHNKEQHSLFYSIRLSHPPSSIPIAEEVLAFLVTFSSSHLLQPRPHPSPPSHLSSCRPTLEPSPTTIRYHPPVYHHSPSAVPLIVKLAPPPSPFAHLLSAFSRSTSQPSRPLSIPQRILTRLPGSGLF
ncbi:hypothetical protein BKA56DRAFT_47241 [Ilyonectria sp. MPI-CAGE-AT-0026]|nr:hypothetical protein BKA56DRAFT_47241 [Ilyonectria sp. MPI-CAGE-AT-0026]